MLGCCLVRAVRPIFIALLALLALTPTASALDIDQDKQPPEGEVGTPYSFQFVAEEGCLPYRFSFSSGRLPPGLRITGEGLLTGTPTEAGLFEFYAAVDDSLDCQSPRSDGLFFMRVHPDLIVATTSVPRATPGQPYQTTLVASPLEFGWPVTWSVRSGTFPPGLSLSSGGVVSGTPTAAGKWAVTVRVQEQFRRYGDRELTFVSAGPLSLPAPASQLGEVGLSFSAALAPVGGLGPMTFSVATGTLPQGLSLNPATGQITGTPAAAGTFPVTLAVADSGGQQATVTAAFRIVAKLTISTKSMPKAKAGKRYVARLAATGGARPLTWRLAGGKLPKGLKLQANGRVTGTPAAAGTFRFSAEAMDRLGWRVKRSFSLSVSA